MPTQTEPAVETASAAVSHRKSFPKRDYILMPLLSLMTMVIMFGIAEFGSRMLWPAQTDTHCDVFDQYGNLGAKPNCVARTKIAEGPWVTYHFNECGYRSNAPCKPKPPGTLRIVLLGSSVSEGLDIPYEQTFAERTSVALAGVLGRKVEIQNLGLQNRSPLHCYRKLNEVLSLRPDLVVYAITPFDLDQRMDPVQLAHRNDPVATVSKPATHFNVSWLKLLQHQLNDSRAVLVAQHFLFSNTATYLRLYLAYGDRADYLRTPLKPNWQAKFSDFNVVLTDMAKRLRQANVPLVLMTVPARPQAALLSVARRPPHTDPFTFGRVIGKMANTAGVSYVDALEELSREPHCDRFFYSVDSHVTGEGNEVISRALTERCLPIVTSLRGGIQNSEHRVAGTLY